MGDEDGVNGVEASMEEEMKPQGYADLLNPPRGDAYHIAMEKAKQSGKQTQMLIDILKERKNIEETYAASLEKLATKLNSLQPDESTQHETMATLKINLLNKAEQTRRLAESVDQDVRTMLAGMMRQHQPVLAKISADGEKMEKHVVQTHSNYMRVRKRYDFASTQGELLSLEARQEDPNLLLQPKEFAKLSLKAFNTAKEATILEKEYQRSTREAKDAQQQYVGHLPLMLEALQDMELKKASCFSDAVKKLVVYETSWLRNLQYDLDAMIKISDIINPEKDHEHFVQSQLAKPDAAPLPEADFVLFPELSQTPLPAVRPRDLTTTDEEILMDIRRAVKAFFDGMEVQKLQTSNTAILRAWVPKVMEEELSLRGAVGPLGTFEIPKWCQSFMKLYNIALDAAEKAMDIWAGLNLMRIAARVHVGSEMMYTKVYNHILWNRVPFWEEALFLTIQSVWQNHAIDRRDRSGWTLDGPPWIQSPYLVDNVDAFCVAMQRFGIRKNQICELAEKVIKSRCDHLSTLEAQEYRSLLLKRVLEPEPIGSSSTQAASSIPGTTQPSSDKNVAGSTASADEKVAEHGERRNSDGSRKQEEQVEEATPGARTDIFA